MKARLFLATATVAAFAFMLSAPAFAQWLNYPTPGIPRSPNGTPNLEAPVPTTADGKPDLSGLYDIDSGRLFQDIAADIRPQDFPIQPWAAALARQREQDMRKGDPCDWKPDSFRMRRDTGPMCFRIE